MLSEQMQGAMDWMRAMKETGARSTVGGHSEPTMAERRAVLEAMADFFPLPADVERTEVSAGGVPAVWLRTPDSAEGQVLLYLHGGAYQSGSSHSHAELAARIARAAGIRALVLDYRLAPEHPFPAALDDAVAAYRWLLDEAGVDPVSIVLAGDSAGGGLVAATLLAVRDAGLPAPAAAALMSAWTDMTVSGESIRTREGADPLLSAANLAEAARDYVGVTDPKDPSVSPLFADLSGLPPLLVQVGTEEILLDDSVGFAESARTAGVDVTLEVAEGLPHVWHAIASAPESTAATERMGSFLAAHLG
jgi:acetyl esterase/lipase